MPEKYGTPAADRPEGEVIWFHALSVGESLALVALIEHLLEARPASHVVLTTSTVTSVAALARAGLPDQVTHSLLPIDTAQAVRRFLDHWDPSLAVFAELDFWPRLMVETHRRGIPMVLVNSRMSVKSFANRQKLGGLTRDILRLFADLLVQDDKSRQRFVELGAIFDRVHVVGALKAAARPLPVDESRLADLQAGIGTRPVWLAAATHPVEEAGIIRSHVKVVERHPEALLIVAPRYLDSADALEDEARREFRRVLRRSRGETPDFETQVYIADTIGEMGLWYRLSSVSFVGHSIGAVDGSGGGGKNPYEAMALGSAVMHGPDVADFEETYEALLEAGASRKVASMHEVGGVVSELLAGKARAPLLDAAARVIESRKGVLDKTWSVLERHLPTQS